MGRGGCRRPPCPLLLLASHSSLVDGKKEKTRIRFVALGAPPFPRSRRNHLALTACLGPSNCFFLATSRQPSCAVGRSSKVFATPPQNTLPLPLAIGAVTEYIGRTSNEHSLMAAAHLQLEPTA